MKTKIKVIIFDWGDVLTKEGSNASLFAFLKKSLGIDHEELVLVLEDFNIALNPKIKTEKEFWNEFAVKKNIILSSNWFEILEKEKINAVADKLDLEMINFVKKLKSKGYRVVVFSNIIEEMATLIRKAGHYDYFEDAVLSCDIGFRKPDLRAYDILLSRLNVKSNQCIFIDDLEENIKAGQEKGIYGIVFKSLNDLKNKLEKAL